MRVTSVDIIANNSDNVINLSFRDPRSQNPYIAKDILGLDADEIVPKYYASDSTDNKFYDLVLKKRDVIIKASLNPNFTLNKSYSDLRDEIYKLIASSRNGIIQLKFKDGLNTKAAISGFVTKVEAPKFTKSPEVQITITCDDDPMLKSLTQINIDPDLLGGSDVVVTDNDSTAPHGFRFGIIMQGETVDFSIQDSEIPNWAFEVNLTGSSLDSFELGDEVHFSSEINNRYLYLIRDFDIIHLVDKIIPTSVWPFLFPGINPFIGSEFVKWDYVIHYPTYWGV